MSFLGLLIMMSYATLQALQSIMFFMLQNFSNIIKFFHFQELHLDSNEITLEGGLMLAEAMANKDALELLKLDTNQFGKNFSESVVLQKSNCFYTVNLIVFVL